MHSSLSWIAPWHKFGWSDFWFTHTKQKHCCPVILNDISWDMNSTYLRGGNGLVKSDQLKERCRSMRALEPQGHKLIPQIYWWASQELGFFFHQKIHSSLSYYIHYLIIIYFDYLKNHLSLMICLLPRGNFLRLLPIHGACFLLLLLPRGQNLWYLWLKGPPF